MTVLALLAQPGWAGAGLRPEEQQIKIQHARFWRGEGTTLLEGTIGVEGSTPTAASATRRLALVIRDDAGVELHREDWVDTLAAGLTGTMLATPFAVALQPGEYTVLVRVAEGATLDSSAVTVSAFDAPPIASDLWLSPGIRVLGENEEAESYELRKGRYAIQRAPEVTLRPASPALWYYLELYAPGSQGDQPGTLQFSITREGAAEPIVRTERTLAIGERGTPDVARLDLAGLPPGSYRVDVTARVGDGEQLRSARFEMAGFETGPPPVALGTAEEALLSRYFAPGVLSDSAVAAVIDALRLSPVASTIPDYVAEMNPEAQRRFLARYWSRLDRIAETPEHELLEEFLGRVNYANNEFGDRQLKLRGVRTDRGRVWLRYGPPDVRQLLTMTGEKDVEIWKYTNQRNLKFAFLDETGFGNFALIFSTDPTEPGVRDWSERVNRDTVAQIVQF